MELRFRILMGLALAGTLPAAAAAQCERSKAFPSSPTSGGNYGQAISIYGSTSVIGADRDEGWYGAAYVQELDHKRTLHDPTDDTWVETFRMKGEHYGSCFGAAVDIWKDTIVVGANSLDGPGLKGRVLVFERVDRFLTPDDPFDDTWHRTAEIFAPDGANYDGFGYSVSLRNDELMIGSVKAQGSAYRSGAVYTFHRDHKGTFGRLDDEWVFVAKLFPTDGQYLDYFGSSVAFDGDIAVVGAQAAAGPYEETGAAYLFFRDVQNPATVFDDIWLPVLALKPSPGAPFEHFGSSVAIEGTTVFVVGSGAYVFERSRSGWSLTNHLIANDGSSLTGAIDVDGNRFAVGGHGAAHVFFRNENGTPAFRWDDLWEQEMKLVPSDYQPGHRFGRAGLSFWDGFVAVGATGDDMPRKTDCGSAYLFFANPHGAINGCPAELSLAKGDRQVLNLNAGMEHAGRFYLVLGSVSGTRPGMVMGGMYLPLVHDAYTDFTMLNPNTPLFVDSMGALGSTGRATAIFDLPSGMAPYFAGMVVDHAFVVYDSLGNVRFCSEALDATLKP